MEFCQSCGMPLSPEVLGSNEDGSKNEEYCTYCYGNGKFTAECTMEEMIEFCIEPMQKENPSLTREEIQKNLNAFMPTLKRWK